MRFRRHTSLKVLPALAGGARVILSGCGRHVRAVETGTQLVSNKHRTATVNTPQFEISATWVPVPWASKHGPIAFLLQIANLGESAVHFDLDGVTLEDSFGRIRGVIPPEKLWRAFSASATKSPRRTVLVAYRRYVRHSRHYRRYYPRHRVYVSSGGFGWGWGPYDYDPYYEQRETARFLAQLLESQTIVPQGIATGFVVFPYDPEKHDELTLWVEIGPPIGATTTQPGEAATMVSLRFEVK